MKITPGGDLDPREVAFLDDLIRRARIDDAALPEIPGGTLHAYLRGRATEEETRSVQEALVGSRRLREELVYLAGLLDPVVQSRFDEASAPARPLPAAIPPSDRLQPGLTVSRRVELRGRRQGGRWLLAGLAAAAVLTLLLVRPWNRPDRWRPEGRLTIDQIMAEPRRGGPIGGGPALTPREAALMALTAVVDVDAGRPVVRDREVPSEAGDPVVLRRGDRNVVLRVPTGADSLEVWRLSLPDLVLEARPLDDRAGAILPDRSGEEQAIVTITFRDGGVLSAAAARALSPAPEP